MNIHSGLQSMVLPEREARGADRSASVAAQHNMAWQRWFSSYCSCRQLATHRMCVLLVTDRKCFSNPATPMVPSALFLCLQMRGGGSLFVTACCAGCPETESESESQRVGGGGEDSSEGDW